MTDPNYIKYLETNACVQAYRIGQLEAALLYILSARDRKENLDIVYLKASLELWDNFSESEEMKKEFNRLLEW